MSTKAKKTKRYNAVLSMFDGVIFDPEYRRMFRLRAKAGDLHPSVEAAMFNYLAGKPTETIDLTLNDKREDLSELSVEELSKKAAEIQVKLEQVPKQDKQMN